jgi:hypothetical protein
MATRFLHEIKFFKCFWKPFIKRTILACSVEIRLALLKDKIF